MSHDHRSLFALEAFCFAMKSPNPLDFVSAVTFGGASELFSTPNLKDGAVEDSAGASVLGAGDGGFCFASKSPKPLVVETAGLAGVGDFGFSSTFESFGDSGF